ncbi:hypothetical protein FORC065_2465 [Yersinia enterocolitica]|nr:hypothetical protein FORC065_2465 [Yersinia enterocolitica]
MDMELTGNNETPEELESLIDGLGKWILSVATPPNRQPQNRGA